MLREDLAISRGKASVLSVDNTRLAIESSKLKDEIRMIGAEVEESRSCFIHV